MWTGHVVLLAGGRALRMRPLSQYVPKCLLPLGDRPIIIRHLERLESIGVQRVTIVLEPLMGSMVEFAITRGYQGKIWIKYLYQDGIKGLGPGYALSLCKDYVGYPLLVYLPDELHYPERFSHTVVHGKEKFKDFDVAVAVAKFDQNKITSIGNIAFDENTGLVKKYINKPKSDEIISAWGKTGGWAFFETAKLFDNLERIKEDPKYKDRELHMAVLIESMRTSNLKVCAFKEETGEHYHFTDIHEFRNKGLSFREPQSF